LDEKGILAVEKGREKAENIVICNCLKISKKILLLLLYINIIILSPSKLNIWVEKLLYV
jgi:hypothetical protein